MFKRTLIAVLLLLLCAPCALADVYTGATVAGETIVLTADSSAQVASVNVQAGASVSEGDVIASLRTTRVYARQDGVIARIQAAEGQEINGTALELQPVSRYDIYCTAAEAYASAATMLIHSGENLYLRCTVNGTHQGTATVTSIDGETYMAEATGGEFYNGETVYLYRDPEYAYASLVGIGTVVATETEVYQAEGRILKLHVQEGEYVERGELLYELIDGDSAEITAPISGLVSACSLQAGKRTNIGETIISIVPTESICIEIQMDEEAAAGLSIGDPALLNYACDPDETTCVGEVSAISSLSEDSCFTVTITPQTPPKYLGMSVSVQID